MTPPRSSALERVPPQSLDAERAALGAMLLASEDSREAIAKLLSRIQPSDFYRTAHQRIYAAISALFEKGEKVDLITVTEQLTKDGELESVGGPAYVSGLVDEMPIASNVDEYARIITDRALARRMMEFGNTLFSQAAERSGDAESLLNQATQVIYDIAQRTFSGNTWKIGSLVHPELERLDQLSTRDEGALTGLPTGFRWLDVLTSGLQNEEMIVLAARPGMGKTSFALNVAEHVAEQRACPVIIFSLEMSAASLVRRLLSARAHVDSQDLRRGHLYPEQRADIRQAATHLAEMPITIDDSSRITPLEIHARARRVMAEAKARESLIIVDYLQLLDYRGDMYGSRPENRQQEITSISRALKAVAKDLKVPIMVLSQLSRAPERREGMKQKPRLSDLRESGAIEQDADVVIFIYQDQKAGEEGAPMAGGNQAILSRVSVAKQRNGPTGTFELMFNRPFTRFSPVSHEDQLIADDE